MVQRLDYTRIAPDAVKGMYTANAYFDTCSVDQRLRRMIELRVSQINGCDYCIGLHRKQALALGESETRLGALSAWRRSDTFSDNERAAIEWAEAITHLHDRAPSDEQFAALTSHFDAIQSADLTAIIANMNALNRMAISLGH